MSSKPDKRGGGVATAVVLLLVAAAVAGASEQTADSGEPIRTTDHGTDAREDRP